MTKKTRTLIASAIGLAAAAVAAAVVVSVTLGSSGGSVAEPSRTPLTVVTPGEPVEPSAAVSSPAAITDDDATEAGWVVEPTTTDAAAYAEAALRAVTTFDTRKATRAQFLEYLKTWMTTWVNDSPGKELDPTQTDVLVATLNRDVLPPADLWDELTTMQATAEPSFPDGNLRADPPSRDGQGFAVTVDVTFRPHDSTEEPWVQSRGLGVFIRCDEYTIPRPGSDQKPGDCKVLGWSKSE
ncbi:MULTISPECIES: hypothetical protein [unclassified Microbacterium]|uniref:hypothetical protein n=1 Tax=unclassified Microbacterium TaxID=2609290 RepID=UPI00301B109B